MRRLFLTALMALAPLAARAEEKASAKTQVTWWGHAAFAITTPQGATILIDPWLTNPKAPKDVAPPEKVDLILVTHGHFDHVGETQELVKKTGAQVFGAFELVSLIAGDKGVGANIGGTFKLKDARVTIVEAVHSSGFGDAKSGLRYAGPAAGFVIQIDKGPTLYHAGDTDVFSSMSLIAQRYKPTVGLLPIGGHFTMDPSSAGLAAKLLGLKTVVPMHFGTFPQLAGTPKELEGALKTHKSNAKVQELQLGKPAQF